MKRSRVGVASTSSNARKKAKSVGIKIQAGRVSSPSTATAKSAASTATTTTSIRKRFIALLEEHKSGISNKELKQRFANEYQSLAHVINDLLQESRLSMSKGTIDKNELYYTLVSKDVAQKLQGLDLEEQLVLQTIEKSGNMGIWTKDIRVQTGLQQQTLNKMFKHLEQRQLIKPVKSVTAKTKKLYMMYDLEPSKELTGGVWYSGLEFDHEFISELRTFIMVCVRRMNDGKGVTLSDIKSKMTQAKITRVELKLDDLKQVVQTLVYDYRLDGNAYNDNGDVLYTMARRVTIPCNFKWWELASPDFHFRTMEFEDGVVLSPHEPHHHSS